MSLNSEQLNLLLEVAMRAAFAAGEVISSYEGPDVQTHLKEGGSSVASKIVTEVDAHAEREILKHITPTSTDYDLGLLTEESTDNLSRFEKAYFWCIDPLDGTYPFTRGEDGYSTSIALVSRDGTAHIGVVYDPRNKNLYSAIKDRGAHKNGQSFAATNQHDQVTIIDGPGGAVMQAINTLELAPCVFYKKPKPEEGGGCLWDYAATSVIQSEAGGFNSDYNFRPINLNASDSVFLNQHGVCYYAGLSQKQVKALIQ